MAGGPTTIENNEAAPTSRLYFVRIVFHLALLEFKQGVFLGSQLFQVFLPLRLRLWS